MIRNIGRKVDVIVAKMWCRKEGLLAIGEDGEWWLRSRGRGGACRWLSVVVGEWWLSVEVGEWRLVSRLRWGLILSF